MKQWPNHARQRTRRERRNGNHGVPHAGLQAGLLGRFEAPPGRNGTAATQIFYREDISREGRVPPRP